MDKNERLNQSYSLDDFGLQINAQDEEIKLNEDALDKIPFEMQNAPIVDEPKNSQFVQDSSLKNDSLGDLNEFIFEPNLSNLSLNERDSLSQPLESDSDIGALCFAYSIFFLVLVVFLPQIYLANNIYYTSKNINYLKSQHEALVDENGELLQKLEGLKFNFLTLEFEEIKQ